MKTSNKNIKWLFFDLGSTLVDETECVKIKTENPDYIIENISDIINALEN